MGLCQLADVQSLCDQSPSLKNQINLDLTLMHHATACQMIREQPV